MKLHATKRTMMAIREAVARIVFRWARPRRVATARNFCNRCQTYQKAEQIHFLYIVSIHVNIDKYYHNIEIYFR